MPEQYDIPPLKLSYIDHTWELKNLKPISLIFGKNGSGKSLYLKTLNRVNRENETQSKDFHLDYSTFYILPERTGPHQIDDNRPSQVQNKNEQMQFSEKNFVENFNQYALQQFNTFFTKLGHGFDQNLKFDLTSKKILNQIKQFFPNYQFEFDPKSLKLIVLDPDGKGISSDMLSSGESQLVAICILLLTQIADWKLDKKEGIILFDEPDLHLDPQMKEQLALLISNLQKEYNIKFLIATHSIIFMTTLSRLNENVSSVYLDRSETKLFAKKLDNKMINFELFLTGKFLMGTLNEIPILLVEGPDEVSIFQNATRNQYFRVYVFPCCGSDIRNHQEFAENLFESVYDYKKKFGCALLDGDKGMPSKPQKFIQYTKLSCHESENLYFTNEVLESIIPDKSMLLEKLKNLDIDKKLGDKRNADFKDDVKRFAKELDSENLSWQERVGKVIGNQRPTGELASFLGTELVDILWPNQT